MNEYVTTKGRVIKTAPKTTTKGASRQPPGREEQRHTHPVGYGWAQTEGPRTCLGPDNGSTTSTGVAEQQGWEALDKPATSLHFSGLSLPSTKTQGLQGLKLAGQDALW